MNSNLFQHKIKAFLAPSGDDTFLYAKQLRGVLKCANVQVLDKPNELHQADCSIHLLGALPGKHRADGSGADDEYWFGEAKAKNSDDPNFRIFIWHPPVFANGTLAGPQAQFVNAIRNSLVRNMIFCNHSSAVMFVEDIRSIIYAEQETLFDSKPVDLFFIYNDVDEEGALGIADLLDDVLQLERLGIDLSSGSAYADMVGQQIVQSKLTVVYFNRMASWAVPFVQQVWKNIGGASANRNILMVGDTELDTNSRVAFDAPNVFSLNTATELIPLEVKVFFDKMQLNVAKP